jgi:hypothetical protein
MAKTGMTFLYVVISMIIILILYTLLVMLIWNNILIKKFPNSNIQKLDFLESLALAVFFTIMTGGGGVSIINQGSSMSFFGYKFI